MSTIVISPERLDTFVGPSAKYLEQVAAAQAYKSVIFTDKLQRVPWLQSPLRNLPFDIERLEFSCNGALPNASRLQFYTGLKTFRIWVEDDKSLESALVDMQHMPALEELEVGWIGEQHRLNGILSAADSALVMTLRRLPLLKRLTLYGSGASPFLRADAFNVGGFSKLRLQELTITGLTIERGRNSLHIPGSLRHLRLHDADLPHLDISACEHLETLSLFRTFVEGVGNLKKKHELKSLMLDGELLDPELAYTISDAVLQHYGVSLPPHFRRTAPRSRPSSA